LTERTQPRTTRPLRSTPTAPSRSFPTTTSRSAGTPRGSVLDPSPVQPAWDTPSHPPPHARAGRTGGCLPTFRARAADQAHVAYMPDTTWPVSGSPPGSSRANSKHPVLMSSMRYDTSPATPPTERGCAPSSWSPPDASRAPFPPRSPRRSSANAAGGGLSLPPQGGSKGLPSSLAQHRFQKLSYMNSLPRSWHTEFRSFGGRWCWLLVWDQCWVFGPA
jgi:hypothetical protein